MHPITLQSNLRVNHLPSMKFVSISFLTLIGSSSGFAPHSRTMSRQLSVSTTTLSARKPFISGNWKLNPQTKGEAVTLASEIAAAVGPDSPDADVALFVPYVFLEAAMGAVNGKLQVGAEVSTYQEQSFLYQFTTKS